MRPLEVTEEALQGSNARGRVSPGTLPSANIGVSGPCADGLSQERSLIPSALLG